MSSNLTASAMSIGIKRARGDLQPFLPKSLPNLSRVAYFGLWRREKMAGLKIYVSGIFSLDSEWVSDLACDSGAYFSCR